MIEYNRGKNRRFREMLADDKTYVAPVAYDCISALLIQKAGFEVIGFGGNGTMASYLGYPDMGLATMTEMVDRVRAITRCVDIPMYCDGDTGYGGLINVRRTVEEMERAGAVAVQFEDQVTPKRCGEMPGVEVIPLHEHLEKLKVAMASRQDPDLAIICRTDAASSLGLDECVRRCYAFAEMGADIIIPCGIHTEEEFHRVITEVPGIPMIADSNCAIPEHAINDEVFTQMGYKIITRGCTTIQYICQALKDYLTRYKQTGDVKEIFKDLMPMEEYNELLGFSREDRIRDIIR